MIWGLKTDTLIEDTDININIVSLSTTGGNRTKYKISSVEQKQQL